MLFDNITLLNGSKLENVVINSGTSFPISPDQGELFYRTDGGNVGLYIYDTATWVRITTATGVNTTGAAAPTNAQYVTLATNSELSAERVLTAGTGITIMDGGANGPVTISASGGGSASAPPGGIEGLAAWWVADDLGLYLADTNPVLVWPNRVPNLAFETLTAPGTQPLYRTNIVNGKSVVRFAGGITERLATFTSRMSQLQNWREFTLIGVAAHANAAPQTKNCFAVKSDGSATAQEFKMGVPTNLSVQVLLTQNNGAQHASPGAYTSARVQNQFYICTFRAKRATRVDQWRDGGARTTSTTFTGGMVAAGADFSLGGDGSGTGFEFEGDIAEFLWYSRSLSFAELDTINAYLAARYNITTAAHS